MSPTATFRPLVIALFLAAASARAQAQCYDWTPSFGAPGVSGAVEATVVFDDGSGPELYVGGSFHSAGDVPANGIAKWNGSRWAALGSGIDAPPLGELAAPYDQGTILALAVFDDGSGPALYAGGSFTSIGGVAAHNIAKWDGASWSPLGSGTHRRWVECLLPFDDGSGPALYVGGAFTNAGNVSASGIARWNGSSWAAVGTTYSSGVRALAIYDDGSGPALYAGGYWTFPFGVPHNIAKWNGTTWSTVGGGIQTVAFALEVFDDGSGPALFLGGSPNVGSSTVLAKWNGVGWTAIGGFTGGVSQVETLHAFDDGSGTALYVGGYFHTAAADNVARWNGTSFSFVGASTGIEGHAQPSVAEVRTLGVYDDGSGAALYAFGEFERADGAAALKAARYDASGWSTMSAGLAPTARVRALHGFDDGSGAAMYVAGDFKFAGTLASQRLAKWNGSSWSAIGANLANGTLNALADFDDGSGRALYVGGNFSSIDGIPLASIARRTGSSWSSLGSGITGVVNTFAVYDNGSGNALYAAGSFTSAGGAPASRVAKWNGTSWSALGSGVNGIVNASAVFDDGSGPKLYVAGQFMAAGGAPAQRIARWNGSSWSGVGGGMDERIYALQVHDDGSGPALYAGGEFNTAGGAFAPYIARWNGSSWAVVGTSVPGGVYALSSFDDGGGPKLFARVHAVLPSELHRWNGTSWSEFAKVAGFNVVLEAFDDGGGPALFVGGEFTAIDGDASVNLARWSRACSCPPLSYCTAGTSSNGCVPSIGAVGTASASGSGSFVVTAANIEGQKTGLLFYGMNGAASAPWGTTTSVLCVKPPQQRTGQSATGGTSGACDGALVIDFNAYVASHPTSLGQPFAVGDTVRMQGWYRDPPNAKTTSLTDALEFYLCP